MTHSDPPPGTPDPGTERAGARRRAVAAVALVAAISAGALALYGMNGRLGNAGPAVTAALVTPAEAAPADDAACASAAKTAERLAPLVKGEIAAFSLTTQPKRLPELAFAGPDGEAQSLTSLGRKLMLVNLWATWCAPCRKEMPALDALQRSLGSADFEVVAINLDARNPEKPKAFLQEIGVKDLRHFTDPPGKSFQALRAVGRGFGLPTTLLVDGKGCEIGFLAGPAEWAGPEAAALVKAALAAN